MMNEYSARSDIMPLMLMDFYAHKNPDFGFYHEQRELMAGNYYPLDFGSFDKNKMLSMQFAADDALSGTVLVYKRSAVNDKEYTVKLNGLFSDKTYNVYDIDTPDTLYTLTGEELMTKGLTIELPDGEKAIILMYSVK